MSRKLLILGIDGATDSITRKLLAMGRLPNLQRLIDRGCFATATPFWPCETGANWATIATGATPATHGCCYSVHLPGTPLDQRTSGFPSHMCQAESIWQATARAGRRAVIFNYPQSHPVNAEGVIHVGGDGCPDPDHNEIFAQQGYTTGTAPPDRVFGNPAMVQVTVEPAEGWANLPTASCLATRLVVAPTWRAGARLQPTAFHLLIVPGSPPVAILCTQADYNTRLGRAGPDAWSDWMVCPVPTERGPVEVAFRMKVIALSTDGRRLHLYLTQGTRTTGYTHPPELAHDLNKHCGHYRRRLVTQQWVVPNACDRQTFLEEAQYQAGWYAAAAEHVFAHHDWDLFMVKWHGPDILHHHSWHLIDPIHPLHDPAQAADGWALFEAVYGTADRMVGRMVEAAGEDAIVAVVSDHGGFAYVFASHAVVQDLLLREGWVVTYPDGSIDWSRTRAYADMEHMFVNLSGRDPDGCVEPEDYEAVRSELMEFMLDMVHPVTGEHLYQVVCRKEDAAFLGYGGDRAGDIFFCFKPLGVEQKIGREQYTEIAGSLFGNVTGSHGPYLPSLRFSEGSEEGIFIASGPGIRRGVRREKPILLTDVAPTLCHLWGIPRLAQAEGRVLADLLA